MSSTPSKERPPLKRPTPRTRPASTPKFKTPPSTKRRRLFEPASTLISKLHYLPGCNLFIDDSVCEKILMTPPNSLVTLLSEESFGFSATVLQGVLGYLFSRLKRENEARDLPLQLVRHLARIAYDLNDCRLVVSLQRDMFDILQVMEEAKYKNELASIRTSQPPVQLLTSFVIFEYALLNVSKAYQQLISYKFSKVDDIFVDPHELEKQVKDAAKSIISSRAKQALEHQSINTANLTPVKKPCLALKTGTCDITEPSALKSILGKCERQNVKTSSEEAGTLKARYNKFVSSVLDVMEAESIEMVDFNLIVRRFDQVVDAWVRSTKKVNASYS
jgi:hypothetical protein